jgi:HSP20 family protein
MAAVIRTRPSTSLTFLDSYRPLSAMDEIDMLAHSLWDSWQPAVIRTGFTFNLDMYEKDDKLVIRAELPGVRKEDLEINVSGDMLTIKGEKKQEEVPEDAKFYLCERCFGSYTRSISLPFSVDATSVSATFKNGLLEIRLPKAEEAKGQRIEVK